MSLTTYAFHHPPVEPTEAGTASQHLLAHRIEVEGLTGLLDVLDVDHPAAIGPTDEDVELGRHQGCPPGAEGVGGEHHSTALCSPMVGKTSK